MDDKPELLPCPFCGGEAVISQYGTPRISTIVECTECACRLETGETFSHGTIWNTRADTAERDALREALDWAGDTLYLADSLAEAISLSKVADGDIQGSAERVAQLVREYQSARAALDATKDQG